MTTSSGAAIAFAKRADVAGNGTVDDTLKRRVRETLGADELADHRASIESAFRVLHPLLLRAAHRNPHAPYHRSIRGGILSWAPDHSARGPSKHKGRCVNACPVPRSTAQPTGDPSRAPASS
jgi:hypothetical protein